MFVPPNDTGLKELLYSRDILDYRTDIDNAASQGSVFKAAALPALLPHSSPWGKCVTGEK